MEATSFLFLCVFFFSLTKCNLMDHLRQDTMTPYSLAFMVVIPDLGVGSSPPLIKALLTRQPS